MNVTMKVKVNEPGPCKLIKNAVVKSCDSVSACLPLYIQTDCYMRCASCAVEKSLLATPEVVKFTFDHEAFN